MSAVHPFLPFSEKQPNGGAPITTPKQLEPPTGKELARLLKEASGKVLPSKDLPKDRSKWKLVDIALSVPTWAPVFQRCCREFPRIETALEKNKYFPSREMTFHAFEKCPLDKVRVVIIGQDPYPSPDRSGRDKAMGMSFSTPRGNAIPQSLKTIYGEIESSMPDKGPFRHGDLTKWAEQGVLLLNKALTVTRGKAGSHLELWTGVLSEVISAVLSVRPKCIFVLWGRQAEQLTKDETFRIRDSPYNLVAGHPSPLNKSTTFPFRNCGHFTKINSMLQKMDEDPIDWNID